MDNEGFVTAKKAGKGSILKGEIPFCEFIRTADDGEVQTLGTLWAKDGKLSFTGNADESAEAFIEASRRYLDDNKYVITEDAQVCKQ